MQLQQPLANYNGNPQVEDGHTKIANELLDIIVKTDFSKRQYKILLFVIRKTYGWNKSEDDISRSQIVEATGLKNPHVTTTIQELLNQNVLIVGLDHDKTLKATKGENRPINNYNRRSQFLSDLSTVDYIFKINKIFKHGDDKSTVYFENLYKKINPTFVFTHTATDSLSKRRKQLAKRTGIKFIPDRSKTVTHSTTIIKKLELEF